MQIVHTKHYLIYYYLRFKIQKGDYVPHTENSTQILKNTLLKEMEYPTFTQSGLHVLLWKNYYLVKCQARRRDF